MKAIEILDAFIREGITVESCGIMSGASIIENGPYRMFGVSVSEIKIKSDCSYLYYYGMPDDLFCFLPSEHIIWNHDADCSALHLWEIEN